MIRRIACAVSCLVVLGCANPPEPERAAPVNQFRSSRDAVTLPDGGQCPQVTITPDSELMIRDLAVVEDPVRSRWTGATTNASDGAWSFGRLMTNMAGPNDPEQFVRTWLQEWTGARVVNGFTVAARPSIDPLVVNPWLAASGGTRLDLTRAPFRLLAIVNRMDLRDLSQGSAGEGRFVFGVLDGAGNPLQFTVILEFNLPATTAADVRRWADDFHALSALPRGSAAFNQALENITNRFAARNVAPTRPNGSSINQVRTNEIALIAPWEMREFKLNAAGQLRMVPVAQTTDLSLDNTPTLASWINANTPALLAGTHVVPATFNGAPFLGGSALTNPGQFWRAPGVTAEARFRFSVNTCNGCHAGETGTTFLHVAPRALGQQAALSTFLTGRTQVDPVSGQVRTMNDLDARASSLGAVLCDTSTSAVTITAPSAGATLQGLVTLSASATGFDFVEYRLDNNFIASAPPPFTTQWNSESFPPGTHTLKAVGIRPSGPVESAPITVTVVPVNAPDFVVTSFTAPTAMLPGAQFTAQATVCNRGNQPGSAPVDLVISNDAVFDPFSNPPSGDMLLGGQFVSLNVGECRALTLNGFAGTPSQPTNPPSNIFFLAALADAPKGLIELVESNNASTPLAVAIGNNPDFQVTLGATPSAARLGSTFTVSATVCNRGTNSGITRADVVLSSNAIFTFQDFRLGSVQLPPLQANQCAPIALRVSSFQQGSFFLGVVADLDNQAIELFETNNGSTPQRFFSGDGVDFRISSVTGPANAVRTSAAFNATVVSCNVGTVTGSAAPSLTVNGAPAGTGTVVTAEPGQCVSSTVRGTSPATAGLLTLEATADLANTLIEVDETNNSTNAAKPLVVGLGPDFQVTVTTTTTPVNLAPGAPLQVTAQVCNRGNVAGTTNLDFVMSTDDVLSLTPPSMDQPMPGAPFTLNAGACASQAFTLPALPPGTFFFGGVVDAFSNVAELVETNNSSAVLRVAIDNRPDFIVNAITLPSSVQPGAQFNVALSICNRGTMSGTTQVELRASADGVIEAGDRPAGIGNQLTLAAGACASQTIATFADTQLATSGVLFMGATADPFNGVPELDDLNNVKVGSTVVGVGPDFQVTAFTAPTPMVRGTASNVTFTTCNRGTQSGVVTVSIAFSPDNFFAPGGNDVLPGATTLSLAAGQCVATTLAVLPPATAGTWFAAALADLSSAVNELVETNNTSVVRTVAVQ